MACGIVFSVLSQGSKIQVIARMREQQVRQSEKLWLLISQLVQDLISPEAMFQFDQELQALLREAGRQILENVLNALEASDHPKWPPHFSQEGET